MFLQRLLQWDICLLNLNDLPVRHSFINLNGTTKSSDNFSVPIGSQLNGTVSYWNVVKFKAIPHAPFIVIPTEVINELSTDQHYGYRM